MVEKITPILRMASDEFKAIAERIYGRQNTKQLMKLLGIGEKQVYNLKEGISQIDPDYAGKLREEARLGRVGTIIRDAVAEHCHRSRRHEIHQAAKKAERELTAGGYLTNRS